MDTLKCSRCSVLLTEDNHHAVCSSDDNIIEYWQCEQCDHIEYGPHEPYNNINTADSVCVVSSKDQPSENLSRNNTMTFTRENKSPAASPSSPTEADGSSDQTKEDSDAESGSVRSINVFSSTMHLSSIDDAELKEMRRVIMGRPCICGGGQTRSVRDTNDGRHLGQYCSICDKLTGIDDSMDMDDLTFLLETGHVRSVACSGCGNDDPNKVTLENVEFTWTFVCSICHLKLDIPSEDPHRHSSPPDGALAHSDDSLHTRNAYTTDPHDSAPPAACNACNNTDLDLLQVGIDYLSKQIKYIKCLICETTDYLCPGGKYPTAGCNGNDKEKHNSEKERIYSSAYLSPGDHICWHQTLAYWHHGIVIDVSDVDEKMVRVIQYTGPIKGGPPKFVNGEITEDWQRIDGRKEELYRVNYEAGISYAPEEVIRRARSRRSEQEYNLVQKNCEHFARWCKTGKEESIQVDSFKNVLYNSTKVAGKWLTKGLIDLMNPKNAAKFTFSDAKCLISSEAAASAPLIALEIFNCYRDLSHEYQRYADGDQKGVEFVKICLKRGSQALGGIGGSIAGGVIGTICMPLVGGLAGRTLGYLVGAYVGAFLGKQLGKIVDRNECVSVGREWRKHQPRRRRRVLQQKKRHIDLN